MVIDDKMLDYISALAKLKIQDEERDEISKSMSDIIGYMETMNELDTDGIEPMSHVLSLENVFRDDITAESGLRDELLANAPEQKEGSFKVPGTVQK